jgi:hypothetical protein
MTEAESKKLVKMGATRSPISVRFSGSSEVSNRARLTLG